MTITLNGQTQTLSTPSSLEDLVRQHLKKIDRVVAEVNGSIIDRERWASVHLNSGDRVELVTFVGGG